MRISVLAGAALLIASACRPWNDPPNQTGTTIDALWSPGAVKATTGGLYVPLDGAGQLLHLSWDDGAATVLDLGPGTALRDSVVTPDEQRLVAFVDTWSCDVDDEVDLEDCDEQDLALTTELVSFQDGVEESRVAVPSHFNALEFSDSGLFALAYLDFSLTVELSGVIDLTSVTVVSWPDAEQGGSEITSTDVRVGFAADTVLFSDDETRAVVLSQSEVAVLDLTAESPEVSTTFPLTLDADDVVDPVGIALSPDGRYALISVEGADDLYILDLDYPSVNIVALEDNPSDMAVDTTQDRTVFIYRNDAQVDILEHALFDLETIELDEGMTDIVQGDGFSILYADNGTKDAYLLYYEDGDPDVVEYRLQNPPFDLQIAPTEDFAVALTRAEGGSGGSDVEDLYDQNPGLEILDLSTDDAAPFLLEGLAVGLEFSVTTDGDGSPLDVHILVLQQDVSSLYQRSLYTGQSATYDLSAPPIAMGAIPGDTGFWITHDSALGLVSIIDPDTGAVTELSGFAAVGVLDAEEE